MAAISQYLGVYKKTAGEDTQPDYTQVNDIYSTGVYSKPAATCTLASTNGVPAAFEKGTHVYFQAMDGSWVHGKASKAYPYDDGDVLNLPPFTYDVADVATVYDYASSPKGPMDPIPPACWVGALDTDMQKTAGCIAGSTTNTDFFSASVTRNLPTSTLVIGTGEKGATGCTTGDALTGGFDTCLTATAQLTVTCTNTGKRSLKGFSTAAKAKMYDASLSSSDCPTPNATIGYVFGCPYSSYVPYFNYYCGPGSPCESDGAYANVIVESAINKDDNADLLTNGQMGFSGASNPTRVEVIQKGAAYMNSWMYAIREFEDAIDDCATGSGNQDSIDASVHAWDEGVAFFVGSALAQADLALGNIADLDDKGFLSYTLGS